MEGSEYADDQLEPVELRLMSLGTALVGVDERAARIVADAMDHISQLKRQRDEWQREACELRRQAAGRREAKARARRPR